MPLPRLIPCLDVADGRVVKGVRFEQLRDVGDPVELGAAYSDAGADELVFLDITATLRLEASAAKPPTPGWKTEPPPAALRLEASAAKPPTPGWKTGPPPAALDKRAAAVATAARVAEQVTIPFTVGGGIRSVDDAAAVLEAGADKVSVNSAALARPELVEELASVLGSQAVVVAIDTEGGRVRSHGATRDAARDTVEWARECEARGAGELLVTSIDRDGTREGYDVAQLERIGDAVGLPVIASGGAGNAQHVADALGVASAALLASILHEDPQRLVSLRRELKELGVCLR